MNNPPFDGNNQDGTQKLKELLVLIDDSQISSIKRTVSELIRLINDPRSSARDLKEVIQLDPPLSAKLLKLANSAYYGFSRTIGDIQEAVVCVGFNGLKELALNQKISQLFNQKDVFAGYSRNLLWKHCVATAICGKLIYSEHLVQYGGNAYVAGLLHDIGIVIEEQFLQDAFFKVTDAVGSSEQSFSEIERQLLGYDHSDIGHAVAMDWNFPVTVSSAIKYHHRPQQNDDPENLLVFTMYIAESICQQEKIGYSDESSPDTETLQLCIDKLNSVAKTKLTDKALKSIGSEMRKNISKMERAGWF